MIILNTIISPSIFKTSFQHIIHIKTILKLFFPTKALKLTQYISVWTSHVASARSHMWQLAGVV